jgi:hypothetical protein
LAQVVATHIMSGTIVERNYSVKQMMAEDNLFAVHLLLKTPFVIQAQQ